MTEFLIHLSILLFFKVFRPNFREIWQNFKKYIRYQKMPWSIVSEKFHPLPFITIPPPFLLNPPLNEKCYPPFLRRRTSEAVLKIQTRDVSFLPKQSQPPLKSSPNCWHCLLEMVSLIWYHQLSETVDKINIHFCSLFYC